MNPLLEQITHGRFTDVADVLRQEADGIALAWDVSVRKAMPQMRHLTAAELGDSTPQILLAIADAMESDDPAQIGKLIRTAPAQGLSRLRLNFDVIEVMEEDRLLRAIIIKQVEAALDRQMGALEAAALHAAIDRMLQRSVIALVNQQKSQLRVAAETELKFLAFLSHDLNNNLSSVTLTLELTQMNLKAAGGFPAAESSLIAARKSIETTIVGMRRMLDHERLRHSGYTPKPVAVDLCSLAKVIAGRFAQDVGTTGARIIVEIPPSTIVQSDGELLHLILQNLVGNAAKYGGLGTVRIGTDARTEDGCVTLWVSDEGPGIEQAQVERIFEAFRRGEVHGQSGVGLGLAIASQAAKLLGAELTVQTRIGAGSTFRIALPEKGWTTSESPTRRLEATSNDFSDFRDLVPSR